LKRYLTRGHENASITERPMKSWAHVLHFAVECSFLNFWTLDLIYYLVLVIWCFETQTTLII
jgi:hypothetical protein